MKIIILVLAGLIVTGCQGVSAYSPPESGTAHGRLPKSPVGSQFQNQYEDNWGQQVIETYQVQADHSVKLINKRKYTQED